MVTKADMAVDSKLVIYCGVGSRVQRDMTLTSREEVTRWLSNYYGSEFFDGCLIDDRYSKRVFDVDIRDCDYDGITEDNTFVLVKKEWYFVHVRPRGSRADGTWGDACCRVFVSKIFDVCREGFDLSGYDESMFYHDDYDSVMFVDDGLCLDEVSVDVVGKRYSELISSDCRFDVMYVPGWDDCVERFFEICRSVNRRSFLVLLDDKVVCYLPCREDFFSRGIHTGPDVDVSDLIMSDRRCYCYELSDFFDNDKYDSFEGDHPLVYFLSEEGDLYDEDNPKIPIDRDSLPADLYDILSVG